MTLLQKVKETISRHEMLEKGNTVLVALSGGPDSVALLHLLCRLRRNLKLDLTAVYINHRLRVRAATLEERFCRQFCDGLNVRLLVVSGDIPALAKKKKKGIEETAREFRYATFDTLARENGYDRIALGHHADDQVETILFRIIRGTGRLGLLGIPARRERIIRPLLGCRKEELRDYLRRNRLKYCVDQSNQDLKYARNYIRHRLLGALRKGLNPQVDQALLNLADSLEPEEEFLEQLARKAQRRCLSVTPGGKFRLDLRRFRGYDMWLRRRLLRRCLRAVCPDHQTPGKEVVDRLDCLASCSAGALSLPGRVRAVIVGDELLICGSSPRAHRRPFEPGEKVTLDWPRLHFSSRLNVWEQQPVRKRLRAKKVVFDCEKLILPLEVRSIRPGDRFQPLGMKGHKKVGDYLTDRKIPREYRDEIPVVCDRKGIIWLVGFEVADRVKVDKNTGKVLTIGYRAAKPVGGPTVRTAAE